MQTLTIDVRMLNSSGIGTYIRELVPRVMAARPDLAYVLLGRPQEAGGWPRVPNASVRWVNCNAPIYSLREQWEILRKTPAETDLLWVPHFNVPLAYRGRLLVTVHDLFHLAMPRFAGKGLKVWAAGRLLSSVRRKASAVLVDSEFTASEFRKYVGEPRRLVVTHLAAGPEWSVRPEGPSPHPRPYFIFVGNVKPHKNLSGLLDAFVMLKDRLPYDLVIVGQREGFRLGAPTSTRRALEMGDRVLFLGSLNREELKRWVAFAQAAVLPSFYEGFGLPPLEAMGLGTPAVVSNRASLPEVCGSAALYIDPDRPESIAEVLERLAMDPVLRQDYASRGPVRFQDFSWDKTLQKNLPVIEECLRG